MRHDDESLNKQDEFRDIGNNITWFSIVATTHGVLASCPEHVGILVPYCVDTNDSSTSVVLLRPCT
jgi:hypothetical protein